MDQKTAEQIQQRITDIFKAKDDILELAGFNPVPYSGQWERNRTLFWPNDALRIVEHEMLAALGLDLSNRRLP